MAQDRVEHLFDWGARVYLAAGRAAQQRFDPAHVLQDARQVVRMLAIGVGGLGEGDEAFGALATWDRPRMPARSAAELVDALDTTWRVMQEAVARWTPAEWAQIYEGEEGDPPTFTRQWVVWHLIEHDLHHGGELSLTLGLHGVVALDL